MPLPGKQVVTTCRDKGRIRQKSWKKMIAVSQNMMLGSLVAPLGAAAPLPDGAATDGNAFLQAFVLDDVASVIVGKKSEGNDAKQAVEGKSPDTVDKDESIEIILVDGAIWQPVAQTIAILPMRASGEAVVPKDTATDGTFGQLSDDQLVQGAEGQADRVGETSPIITPAAAAFTAGTSRVPLVWSTRATEGDPKIDALKQNAEAAPDFQSGNAPKPTEALQSAHPNAVSLGKDLTPQKDAATKRPGQPHHLDAPFAKAANVATTPAEQAKQPYFGPDATIAIAEIAVSKVQHGPRFSAAEAAWRQKWLGDITVPTGNNAPDIDQTSLLVKTDLAPTTGPIAAPTLRLAVAGEEGAGPNRSDDAMISKQIDLPVAVNPLKSAAPDTMVTSIAAAFATLPEDTSQSADSVFEARASFDAVSLATGPAATLSATQPSVPLQSPVPPSLPAALSPTIVEMTKSGNDGPLELALSPEELGRLTISIKHDGDFVRVTVIADRPETLDLMRRHAGDLVADLRQAGFSGASLSFGQGGQGGQPRFVPAETATKDQSPPQHLPPETKPTAPNRSRKGSGVDLRF